MAMNINKKTITQYAAKYDRDYPQEYWHIEQEMKSLLSNQRYLTKEQLKKIGVWKSPRIERHYKNHDEHTVSEITKFGFTTTSEEARLLCLISLRGVGFPVASTILHFAFPDKYPIMDFRVVRSLGWKKPSNYNFRFWQEYCKEIIDISQRLNLPIRIVEKALWKYDKDKYT